jgi:hypothetical protein
LMGPSIARTGREAKSGLAYEIGRNRVISNRINP